VEAGFAEKGGGPEEKTGVPTMEFVNSRNLGGSLTSKKIHSGDNSSQEAARGSRRGG